MKCSIIFMVVCMLGPVLAEGQTSAKTPVKKIPSPLFLKPTDKVPPADSTSPSIPQKGPDGKPLEMTGSITAPSDDIMAKFSDPDLLESLRAADKKETRFNKIYWHLDDGWDYCHLRDAEGNHWFGWSDGGYFHWVLLKGKHYWWHDDFAECWLYYGGRYWCRAENQTPDQLQVLINGEYYLCQRDGTILKDMGQNGKGSIISNVGVSQGGSHHRNHAGHGGHKSTGSSSSPGASSGGTNTANP